MMSEVTGLYSWQWSWQANSARPEDAITNTFHFINTDTVTDYDNVRDMLVDFYTATNLEKPVAIREYMSQGSITGEYVLKAYALEDPKPRQPVITYQGSFSPPNTPTLPSEVALVMSFQAELESGEIAARRRNRVYLGPFGEAANKVIGRPEDELVQCMLFSGKQLIEASSASLRWTWVVYSPTTDQAYPVNNGWVDNSWDTQRRRGLYYSQRGTYTIDSPT
jgi:hypothetical protein